MIKVILYVYIRYVFILNLFRLYTSTIQHYNSNRRKKRRQQAEQMVYFEKVVSSSTR